MDKEGSLSSLLEACDAALERLKEPALGTDRQLVADLEKLRAHVFSDLVAVRQSIQ